MSESSKNSLNIPLERALFENQVQGIAVAFYENERPPQGLAGIMDWYVRGAISRCVQKGAISGKVGECTYFPFSRNGATFHLILAGAGASPNPGERKALPSETIHTLTQNLSSLGLNKVGISKEDFGGVSSDTLFRSLKGVPLWIAP